MIGRKKTLRRAALGAAAQGMPPPPVGFTGSPRRRKLRLLVIATSLAFAGLATWGGLAYRDGAVLTVSRLEVTGNRHWTSARLLEQAGLEVGQRFHEIPFRAARRNLLRLPGVESATLRYVPGGRLRLEVRESDVVALRHTGRVWRGLTPAGDWMPLSPRAEEDAPVFENRGLAPRSERAAAAFLTAVRSKHPELFAGFSQISPARGRPEADVYWRDGRVKLRLDYTDASLRSLEYLGELMRREQGSWPEGATVDLRVEGYAYVL